MYVSTQLFSLLFVISLYSSMLNLLIQLALLFYCVLYPVWCTSPPQDPIIRSSAAQRTEDRFVPVLGSTPSTATLLGSYPRVHISDSMFNIAFFAKFSLPYNRTLAVCWHTRMFTYMHVFICSGEF